MKNLINNIDLFDFFNVYITDKKSKEYLVNTFGANINMITVDFEEKLETIIQNIIYQLYYFN